jgi:hypothetical protein
MSWTVIWRPSPQNDLAQLWLDAADRGAVRDAADAIDANLARDPYAWSESRWGQMRIMIVAPLAVLSEVDDANRLVTVLAVWRIH